MHLPFKLADSIGSRFSVGQISAIYFDAVDDFEE